MQIAIKVVQVIAAVLLILMVLVQSGKSEGLSGAIAGGGSKSFMGKNKSHSWDAKMARATKWVATVFIVLTFVLSLV